jgi:hypothetical protein
LKITLTSAQAQEIKSKALTRQQEAEKAFKQARDAYNSVMYLAAGEIELAKLIELTAGLPDGQPEPAKPVTTILPSMTKRYQAYSRSGRRAASGGLEVHDIVVSTGVYGGATVLSCTCPGFKNHGHCWASDEAKLQAGNTARRSGTNSVWKVG